MTRNKKSYKNLIIWERADVLVTSIYKSSKQFPKHELYGLTSQLRRAALSVVLNIVEGHARKTSKEYARFLDISLGSLAEVEYLLELALKLGYLTDESYDSLESIRSETGRVLWSYKQKI